MPVTCILYNSFKLKQFDGNAIDLDTDTIKVALVASGYTPNLAHDFFDDITNEATGAGYTAGGKALINSVFSGTTTVLFDADDTQWIGATITARYAVLYKDTGNPATSPLIGYIDFGEDKSITTGVFIIQWNATDKIIKITSS